MPVIGLTGGIATGKSAVARLLRERGAEVLSADEAARDVVRPGSPVLARIVEAFGPGVLLPDGSLDRAALGRVVFADEDARLRLEAITHPAILALLRQRIDAIMAERPEAWVVVETPLLYEAGMEDWFDRVVVVTAPEHLQVARLRERDGYSEEEARRRIAAQMPLAEKAARADVVLSNDRDLAWLEQQVDGVGCRL
jgi:dephospho-CoA kinase